MPYNHGMAHITLVLPFALPIPEFAPDLVRALAPNAPALGALLSRTSRYARVAVDDTVRALPHEQWLAKALGLADERRPALAAAAMRGRGIEPGAGTWFIVNPAHIVDFRHWSHGEYLFRMANGQHVTSSRSYSAGVQQLLKRFA